MAKLTLTDMTTGYQSADAYNANNALIEAALENTFSLDGSSPNALQDDLDVNSNDINNVLTLRTTNLILNGTSVVAGGITSGEMTVDLDMQANSIISSIANQGITIAPNGTGNVILGTLELDADQVMQAGIDGYVLTYSDATGLISLEAASGGGGGGGTLYWGRVSNTGTDRGGSSGFTISKTSTGRFNVDFTAASLGLTATDYAVTAILEKFSPGGYMVSVSQDATDFTLNIYNNANALADDYCQWMMAID